MPTIGSHHPGVFRRPSFGKLVGSPAVWPTKIGTSPIGFWRVKPWVFQRKTTFYLVEKRRKTGSRTINEDLVTDQKVGDSLGATDEVATFVVNPAIPSGILWLDQWLDVIWRCRRHQHLPRGQKTVNPTWKHGTPPQTLAPTAISSYVTHII